MYPLQIGLETIELCAKRFSDYDNQLHNENEKITGRRPRQAKDFRRFEDIVADYKGKDEKWVDDDAPKLKDGYEETDMIKEPFVYRAGKEVWPDKVEEYLSVFQKLNQN